MARKRRRNPSRYKTRYALIVAGAQHGIFSRAAASRMAANFIRDGYRSVVLKPVRLPRRRKSRKARRTRNFASGWRYIRNLPNNYPLTVGSAYADNPARHKRLTKDARHALRFATKYPGWHGFSRDAGTARAIRRLAELGYIETNEFRQFRLRPGIRRNQRGPFRRAAHARRRNGAHGDKIGEHRGVAIYSTGTSLSAPSLKLFGYHYTHSKHLARDIDKALARRAARRRR